MSAAASRQAGKCAAVAVWRLWSILPFWRLLHVPDGVDVQEFQKYTFPNHDYLPWCSGSFRTCFGKFDWEHPLPPADGHRSIGMTDQTLIRLEKLVTVMKSSLLLALTIVILVSPAPLRAAEPGFREGSHRSYDLDVTWKCGMEGKRYTVTGTMKNIWVMVMSDLELTVRMFASDGSEIGRATYFFIPRDYAPGDSSYFGVAVPMLEGRQVKRLEFRFHYYVDNDDFGNLPMFTDFDTDVEAPRKPEGGALPDVRKGGENDR
jgi:hypothetical protein